MKKRDQLFLFTALIIVFSVTCLSSQRLQYPDSLYGKKYFSYDKSIYTMSPNGLKKFLKETEMPAELKSNLTNQMQSIKKRKRVADIIFWGTFLAGVGIMANEAMSVKEYEKMKSGTLFTGLGIVVGGVLVNIITKPKKKDYLEFFNSFNKSSDANTIKIGFKIDYTRQMNYGIVISF